MWWFGLDLRTIVKQNLKINELVATEGELGDFFFFFKF